jgi:hypothetical protein
VKDGVAGFCAGGSLFRNECGEGERWSRKKSEIRASSGKVFGGRVWVSGSKRVKNCM